MKLTCGDWVPSLSRTLGGWGVCGKMNMTRNKRDVVMESISKMYVAVPAGDNTEGRGRGGECEWGGE